MSLIGFGLLFGRLRYGKFEPKFYLIRKPNRIGRGEVSCRVSEMCVVSKERPPLLATAHNRDTEQIRFRTDHEDYKR